MTHKGAHSRIHFSLNALHCAMSRPRIITVSPPQSKSASFPRPVLEKTSVLDRTSHESTCPLNGVEHHNSFFCALANCRRRLTQIQRSQTKKNNGATQSHKLRKRLNESENLRLTQHSGDQFKRSDAVSPNRSSRPLVFLPLVDPFSKSHQNYGV